MKNLDEYIVNEKSNQEGFDLLKPILRKTGWPQLEIEDDIMSNNLTKEPKYNKFKNGNVFVSNDCFFIDKYGKIYYKTFIKYIIF